MKRLDSAARSVPAIALLLAVLCAGCAAAGDARPQPSPSPSAASTSQPSPSSTSLPEWLRVKIGQYEALPADRAPLGIWRITHKGQPAYYMQSPCCDQFNPLYDAAGAEICNPSGGFTGRGDGKCPTPMDPGTEAKRVWSHFSATSQSDDPPGLTRD